MEVYKGLQVPDLPSNDTQRRPSCGDVMTVSQGNPQSSLESRWDFIRRRVKLTTGPAHGVGNVNAGKRSILKRGSSRRSLADSEREHQEKTEYQNTYRLDPDKPFNVRQVEEAIRDILEALLSKQEYDVSRVGIMTKRITEAVKTRVKSMRFSRHKIIVHTAMGSKTNQGIEIGSRCLWNQNTDRSATVFYENRSLFTVVTVYGIYYE